MSQRVTAYVAPEVAAALDHMAAADNRTVSNYVSLVLAAHVAAAHVAAAASPPPDTEPPAPGPIAPPAPANVSHDPERAAWERERSARNT